MNKFSATQTVTSGDSQTACDFLAGCTGLSKVRIKDAMVKGAVWIRGRKGGRHRLRRAKAGLRPGDVVEIHFDPAVLSLAVPPAELIKDLGRYSFWRKPAGMLCQGTLYGDHCSLPFFAERYFTPRRKTWPVHRIDREASGLVLVGHDKAAASALSALFRDRRMEKRYRVTVKGCLGASGQTGRLDALLDGKRAMTEYTVLGYEEDRDTTDLDVRIHTGRRHQIRRHLNGIGHPVMGDPRYGKGNKNSTGLQLTAEFLSFICPLTGIFRQYNLP